ncbi:MAG: cytochrome c biogenesis CcdA family protein [Treponema sp.]|nr:cytochrome c biogenesis CcdA family protein [Treponema sp.]
MADNISIPLAFTAGLFSFLSPCVFPLIPSWLCLVGGISLEGIIPGDTQAAGYRRRLIPGTLSFILGFSLAFVVLGILFSGFFLLLGGAARILNGIAGLFIIFLGLQIYGDFFKFLNHEKRFHLEKPRGIVGSFLAGAAFGVGWTPCVGPILGSILLLAGQEGKIGRAVLCLSAYSAGLGLPFLGAALALEPFLKKAPLLRPYLPRIRRIGGLFLIGMGLLIFLGHFQTLNSFLMSGEYAFINWAGEGGPLVRLVPALFFFLLALLIPVFRLLRKKTLLSRGPLIFLCLCGILGVLQILGFLDCAELLAHWFLYRQKV